MTRRQYAKTLVFHEDSEHRFHAFNQIVSSLEECPNNLRLQGAIATSTVKSFQVGSIDNPMPQDAWDRAHSE